MFSLLFKDHTYGANRITTSLVGLSVLAGMLLSIMYVFDICTEACSEAAAYKLFGMDFSLFGVLFFLVAAGLLLIRKQFPVAHLLLVVLYFSSAGAEMHFIWLQKYEIGKWCPICLSIATAVYIGCFTLFYETMRSGSMKTKLRNVVMVIFSLTIGLASSGYGVSKEIPAGPDLFLGKSKSAVTVYVVSDWFCPACKTLEPKIEEIYNAVSKQVRVSFVDFPIHRETNNFTPYNLQFLMFEKAKYIQLRAVLANLAKQTPKPSDAQVQAAVAPLGVKLRQMDSSDIVYGLQHNMTVYRGFGVKATPSVVIANDKTKKQKILVGGEEITVQAVKSALAEVN